MSEVITYANNNYQCFCQIKLPNREKVLISIASAPTPSVKIVKLGFLGLWPIQTIWEYNPTMAGGYDAYVRKMMIMFQDPLAVEPKHPLDILRDRLLPCASVSEVREFLFEAERSISELSVNPKTVGKLAIDLDPEQSYLSGLLLRFDEEHSNAIFFFSKLNPGFKQPPIPKGSSEAVRAGFAAHALALSIAFQAMGSQGKLMVASKEVSIVDGALGLSYALFIWILLKGYLEEDGVEIDSVPLVDSFAELFVYLDDAQREELAKKGVEIFQDMIKNLSNHPNLQEWHGMLSKNVQLWLISTTSDKRTKEHDEDLRKAFGSQLGALYAAAERTRKDAQE